ncbi:hypothetical protein AB6D11_28150, partial [Vibrio splendidus]
KAHTQRRTREIMRGSVSAYRNGHGTWSDFVKALAWFEIAQEYGNSDAEKEIIDVKQYMSKENIAAAEQLKDSLIEDIW